MVSNLRGRAALGGATFVLWGLVAASIVAWGLKFSAGPSAPPPPVAARGPAPIDPSTVARLLGSSPGAISAPAVSAPSRFLLVGVVATPDGQGAALIGVDGKPPRPYRVGATVEEGLLLRSVDPREARLGPPQGPPTVTLAVPNRATSSLAGASSGMAPARAMPNVQGGVPGQFPNASAGPMAMPPSVGGGPPQTMAPMPPANPATPPQ